LIGRAIRRSFAFCVVTLGLYALLLVHPGPLFAYELRESNIVVHATTPIPEEMRDTLKRVKARLGRTAVREPDRVSHVFICEPRWLFALFARTNYRVGGVADAFVGQHVFLRESDMVNDRLIGPGGRPVAADRPLSYFIAHELMHIAHARAIGRRGYARMPRWLDDGHADYVARDIDLAAALQELHEGGRQLDPQASGLYIRYQLMVAYLLEKKGLDARSLLAHPVERAEVERELAILQAW
jgi:hypothetical protein